MKKILLSTVVVIAFAAYGLFQNKSSGNLANSMGGLATSTQNSSVPVSYKDGTYTGQAADAFYGNIQVQATISGGRITNVQFLQAPSDRSRSIEINQYADPVLAQEAIKTQNAQVDTVSGATDTSEAFVQSLTSALSLAKS